MKKTCSICHSPFTTDMKSDIVWDALKTATKKGCSQCSALRIAFNHFFSERISSQTGHTNLILTPESASLQEFVYSLRAYSDDDWAIIVRYSQKYDNLQGMDRFYAMMDESQSERHDHIDATNRFDKLGAVEFYQIDSTLNLAIHMLPGRPSHEARADDDPDKLLVDWKFDVGNQIAYKRLPKMFATPQLPVRQHIRSDTSSEEAIAAAKNWLKFCCCQSSAPMAASLPKRTIYLGESNNEIRLVENGSGSQGLYVALSHCWGIFKPLQTTKQTLRDCKERIAFESLPRTFQDAVDFVRRLGIRQLWIDSMCIVQDDEDDWAMEASKMAEIFSNAFVTIAAAASRDARGGCYRKHGVRPLELKLQRRFWRSWKIFARPQVHNYGDEHKSALINRAWIFQEQFLSRRVLYFHESELVWKCDEMISCQCGAESPPPLTSRLSLARPVQDDPPPQWREIIERFTRRQLTRATDRLPALSGTARRFQQEYESVGSNSLSLGRYLAGLWERYLIELMIWSVDWVHEEKMDRIKALQDNSSKNMACEPEQYHAPSWSWASVNVAVLFKDERNFTRYHMYEYKRTQDDHIVLQAELVSAQLKFFSPDPFGRLEDAHLDLRTIVLPGRLALDDEHGYVKAHISLRTPEKQEERVLSFDFDSDVEDEDMENSVESSPRDVLFVILKAWAPKVLPRLEERSAEEEDPPQLVYCGMACLIVERAAEHDNRYRNSFKRIGIVEAEEGINEFDPLEPEEEFLLEVIHLPREVIRLV